MNDPGPQPEKMSLRALAMFVLGGFAVGLAVGPVLLLQMMFAWLGGVALFLAVTYFYFIFPFPFDLLFGNAKRDVRESPRDNLLSWAALTVGLVLGTATAIFVVAPEGS